MDKALKIANTFGAAADAKSKGEEGKPMQHLDMDPVTVEGKMFCPGCGQVYPDQGLPKPYKEEK